jgi:hypothetical protein
VPQLRPNDDRTASVGPLTSRSADPYGGAAKTAGVLLILGVLTSLVATGLVGSAADASAPVRGLAGREGRVLVSAFFQFATAAGAVGIAVALYPAVRSHSATLAAGAVAFRAVEAGFACLAALSLLALLVVSQTGVPDVSLWSALVTTRNAANFVFGVFFFGLGAAHYLIGLDRARLLPRWLTLWGMAGAVLVMLAAAVTLFGGQPFSLRGALVICAVPIATQEVVLGVWLLRVGFRAPPASSAGATALAEGAAAGDV